MFINPFNQNEKRINYINSVRIIKNTERKRASKGSLLNHENSLAFTDIIIIIIKYTYLIKKNSYFSYFFVYTITKKIYKFKTPNVLLFCRKKYIKMKVTIIARFVR